MKARVWREQSELGDWRCQLPSGLVFVCSSWRAAMAVVDRMPWAEEFVAFFSRSQLSRESR